MRKSENIAIAARLAVFLFFISFSVSAQKLPKVQTVSLAAPDNIRIDGKSTEWADKFQAYNNSTDIFYTISNDDDKLYLIVKATDRSIAGKIIAGGVTLTINPSGKKNDKDKIAITFPVYDQNKRPDIDIINNPELMNQSSKADVSAAVSQANKKLISSSKEIKMTGTKIITDTLISVYNDAGIKVAARFNSKGDYIYELALPVKYLGLTLDKPTKFTYNVRLNEPEDAPAITASTPGAAMAPVVVKDINIFQTTDFWGAYTLAKK